MCLPLYVLYFTFAVLENYYVRNLFVVDLIAYVAFVVLILNPPEGTAWVEVLGEARRG